MRKTYSAIRQFCQKFILNFQKNNLVSKSKLKGDLFQLETVNHRRKVSTYVGNDFALVYFKEKLTVCWKRTERYTFLRISEEKDHRNAQFT